MMKSTRSVTVVIAAVVLIAVLGGCQKEGPAERAGKQVDKAVDKAGEQIEKAGDKIKDAASDAKK
jgi:predicted small secreted protein